MTDINAFYSVLKTKVNFINEFREAYSPTLAPDFNSLDFWPIGENKVSEIICFLLDPNAAHGQKDAFLKLFLKTFGITFHYECLSDIFARTEQKTYKGRRIDIFLQNKRSREAIAIENKIFAWTKDQQEQINDYLRFLSIHAGSENFSFLYLSPKSKTLSSESYNQQTMIGEGVADSIQLISYEEHFIPFIHKCALYSENERVRNFILDFEIKLKSLYLNMDTLKASQTVQDYITESSVNLSLTFELLNNLTAVKNNLREKLDEQLQDLATELDIAYDPDHRRYTVPALGDFKVGVSFEEKGVFYGIVRKTDGDTSYRFPEIENLFTEKFDNSHWWPLYLWHSRSIETTSDFWQSILDGSFKSRIKIFLEVLLSSSYNIDNDKTL